MNDKCFLDWLEAMRDRLVGDRFNCGCPECLRYADRYRAMGRDELRDTVGRMGYRYGAET